MNKRDDFSEKTKKILGERCAYRCSNPNCRSITIGAHSVSNKSMSIGRACHIEAASLGGPRYNRTMLPEQRKSIENGIWLCATCADMIDKDINEYSVDVLKAWKHKAEKLVSPKLGVMCNVFEPRIFSIANPAGGTGKSFVSSAISITLSKMTNDKVCCISACMLDHALRMLELKDEINSRCVNQIVDDKTKLSIHHSLRYNNVFAITFDDLRKAIFEQKGYLGKSDVKELICQIANKYDFKYIVCDCGRGDSIDFQLDILLSSSDVIVPLGQHSFTNEGLQSILEVERYSALCNNIWILYSIGYLSQNQKLNIDFRKRQIEVLEMYKDLNCKIHELKNVIPKNNSVEICLWKGEDIFMSSVTKNIRESYQNIVVEMLQIGCTLV